MHYAINNLSEMPTSPVAMLVGDLHWSATPPSGFPGMSDTWKHYMRSMMRELAGLQKEAASKATNPDSLHMYFAGDVFHRWQISTFDLVLAYEMFAGLNACPVWCIYGNHDLPQHNMERASESSLYALSKMKLKSFHAMPRAYERLYAKRHDLIASVHVHLMSYGTISTVSRWKPHDQLPQLVVAHELYTSPLASNLCNKLSKDEKGAKIVVLLGDNHEFYCHSERGQSDVTVLSLGSVFKMSRNDPPFIRVAFLDEDHNVAILKLDVRQPWNDNESHFESNVPRTSAETIDIGEDWLADEMASCETTLRMHIQNIANRAIRKQLMRWMDEITNL